MNDEGYGPVTAAMVERLRETRPWVRLVSILGFVVAGICVLAAVVVPLVGVAGGEEVGVAAGLGMGLVYGLVAMLYGFTSMFLFRYASAIDSLLRTRETLFMEQALDQQKGFWRLAGIISLVYIAIIGLIVLAGLAALLVSG